MELDSENDLGQIGIISKLSKWTSSPNNRLYRACQQLDDAWYADVVRKGRWMDIVSDYAGQEPFVVDGESLICRVLDDPLLALGKEEDPAFQLPHACHLLESFISNLKSRRAVFDIVFWEDNVYSIASRILAREILIKHVKTTGVRALFFRDLSDPAWLEYRSVQRPMFVMMSDGGSANNNFGVTSSFLRRLWIQQIHAGYMSVALMNGLEFRDFAIMTFILERQAPRFDSEVAGIFALNANFARQRLSHKSAAIAPPTSYDSSNLITDRPSFFVQMIRSTAFTDSVHLQLLYLFSAHLFLLDFLSIHERAQPPVIIRPDLISVISCSFLPIVYAVLRHLVQKTDLDVDIDGRLFLFLVQQAVEHPGTVSQMLGEEIRSATETAWSSAGFSLSQVNLHALETYNHVVHPPVPALDLTAQPRSLLPFSNPIFDEPMKDSNFLISNVEADTSKMVESMDTNTHDIPFEDSRHWHSTRLLVKKYPIDKRPTDPRAFKRWQRRQDVSVRNIRNLAENLTGGLKPIVIPIVGSGVHASSAKPATNHHANRTVVKKVDVLRAAASKARQDDVEVKGVRWWKDELKSMSAMGTWKDRRAHLISIKKSPTVAALTWLQVEVRLYELHVVLREWIDSYVATSCSHDEITVEIMRLVMDIRSINPTFLAHPCAGHILNDVLVSLGFDIYSQSIVLSPPDGASETSVTSTNASSKDTKKDSKKSKKSSNEKVKPKQSEKTDSPAQRELKFRFVQLLDPQGRPRYQFMLIHEHPVEWQLRLWGPYMDRSMDSKSDKRVAFVPDAWQRKALDAIDRPRESMLVVAPTSAGKTFISFYAMEKVLRESDNGIIIYIAPTKALVMQIAAEIYARFVKTLKDGTLWAIHTRDYRINDPAKCQILVTVPEILATLLLSPAHARTWTPRLKRIILDEIHTIGQQEGGRAWEQILLLAPCPIIGLSATIGSPDKFNKWLENVQHSHGCTHTFIQHNHRYSHLRKFLYLFPENLNGTFEGLQSYKPTNGLAFIHPMSLLSTGASKIPSDLALEARDTLTLYNALAGSVRQLEKNISSLSPANFFSDKKWFLAQRDIISYENSLKVVVVDKLLANQLNDLESPLHGLVDTLTDSRIVSQKDALNRFPTREQFLDNLIFLVSDLHASNNLPAILFTFDRSYCEIIGHTILSQLEEAEEQAKLGTSSNLSASQLQLQ
ncbi:hypothetical protein FISHEDRAFT_76419 [Fistulina hepatica ATCC 64428]|uniref:Helicase ATP-binding domain-containing protein n=1 Tax=Fistulina hepatica ATCC 64428 TaxID=1128425 RepID=A0A0D7A4A2_9AGAR|nr:hypothetical protein FISHEDRAFT_76419 [Fistulina hepatica ATCC 64428]